MSGTKWLLLATNLALWLGILAYACRLIPPLTRYWRPWLLAVLILVGAGVSLLSYQQATRIQVRERFQKHYWAGLDEKERGNLAEAEREFQEARRIIPGDPRPEQALKEIQEQKPAEQREQKRATAVDPKAAPASAPSQTTPPPSQSSAGQPSPAAPPSPSTPPATPPTPEKGRIGERPKPAPHKPSPFEISHYALEVTIDPAKHLLDATATIRVRSRGQSISRLEFSLNKEFVPTTATVDGAPARFEHPNDLLAVTPARALSANGEATLTIRYLRQGRALVEGGDLISPEGTYLRSEARWYPATGELDFRAPVRVLVTVPSGYTAVSVGELRNVAKGPLTTRFHWETPHPASMVSLAVAKYLQQTVMAPMPAPKDGPAPPPLPVTCYTFPQHKDRAPQFLKEAVGAVRFYSRLFGPYPYEKLAIVEIPLFPGGYGTTSFVMLIDKSFEERKPDREFLAHEIAHQWWGNSVFPQGLGAAWLTEAFSNYSAWMYDAAASGNPRILQKRVALATSAYFAAVEREGDQAIAETDPYQPVGAVQQILYEKGAVVLHMLRAEIGDGAFRRTLRAFADSHRFGKASIADFRKAAEEASGRDLDWFFDQWLGREGGLFFTYSFTTEPRLGGGGEAVITVTQEGAPYRARIPVTFQVENDVQRGIIELTEAQGVFRFPVSGKVGSVLFDPDGRLLMKPPRWMVAETAAQR